MKIKQPCPRIIRPSKYERNDPSNRDWWNALFKMLEEKYSIPQHRKIEVIKEIFPDKILEKILSILSFIEPDVSTTARSSNATITSSIHSTHSLLKRSSHNLTGVSVDSYPTTASQKQLISDKNFLARHLSVLDIEQRKKRQVGPPQANPYLQFFKRRDDRAAIWRPLPPISLEEMSLTQKAEAITEAIARDFVDWLKNMGGEEEPSLDVPTVMKMFEIGFHMHAATSLCVRIKEMPSVPQQVADKRRLPESSIRATLHHQLKHDIDASQRPTKLFAFGTMLPKEMRYRPPKDDITTKWLGCTRVKKELATMSAVWEGITHLRSTKGFCNWLIEHPEIDPPEYLQSIGMLDPNYIPEEQCSVDTKDSLNVTILPPGIGDDILQMTGVSQATIAEEIVSDKSTDAVSKTPTRKTF